MLRLIVCSAFIFILGACSSSDNGGNGNSGAGTPAAGITASEFKTTISVDTNSIVADGVSIATITVQAIALDDTDLITGGDAIALATTLGSLSPVTDNNDGTYTAILTSSTQQALSLITGTLNGAVINEFAGVANRIDKTDPSFIAMAALGSKIFNDADLSEPGGQSCASCHDSTVGFDDPDMGVPSSLGADGASIGKRNSQTASYAAHIPQQLSINTIIPVLIGGQFWDGRAATLEEQAKQPFLNPVEMNNADKASVIAKIKLATYMAEFETVFGVGVLDDVPTAYDQMTQAIAAFQRTVLFTPFTSKFDDVQKGMDAFTVAEANGRDIFFGIAQCGRCHSTPVDLGEQMFSNFEYFNIGVPANPALILALGSFVDNGLGDITMQATDNGKFRVPSLRNIANTAPYMHNGVFATLSDVIDFYNGDLGATPEVNANLADGGQYIGFGLNAGQKADLEAFLNTFSD